MPRYPYPALPSSGMPLIWASLNQQLVSLQQQVTGLRSGAAGGNLVDQYGNTVEVAGTSVLQTVTIGASQGQPGVQVMTGVSGAGRVAQQNLATGTITTTQGSPAATLDFTTSGTFATGQVIGAADVSDPSTGIATPAITPGTTFTIAGLEITLSQPAAESGSAIYCAACNFAFLSSSGGGGGGGGSGVTSWDSLTGAISSAQIATVVDALIVAAFPATINAQIASYTAALSDNFNIVIITDTSASEFTIPPDSSVAWPVGSVLTCGQGATGAVTFTAGDGVTFGNPGGLATPAQYAFGQAVKVKPDEWWLSENLV